MRNMWTDERIERLIKLKEDGSTFDEIAKELNASIKSVQNAYYKYQSDIWTPAKLERLFELNALGNSTEDIASIMKIDYKKVEGALSRHGCFESKESKFYTKKLKKSKVYIITSAIPSAKTNTKFLAALKKYASHTKGELVVLPTVKNKPWNNVDPSLGELIPSADQLPFYLNDNVLISDYQPNINTKDPISGLDSMVSEMGSMILSGTRHRARMVARTLKANHSPRAMWCTGTISEPYYKDSKSGKSVKHLHTYGALIVEVKNKEHFFVRQLTWDGKGFYDLDKYVTAKSVKSGQKLKLLNMGDDHALEINPNVKDATKELIKKLSPEIIIHHDTLDCASITHHAEGKFLTKAMFDMSLEEEAKITAKYIDEMLSVSKAKHYLVASNHPEHLTRYLNEGRYLNDRRNHILALELALAKAKGKDPVEVLLSRYSKLNRFNFLQRKDSLIVGDIEQANHGDEGTNGARATPTQVGISYNGKVTSGHTHTAEIGIYNNHVNGTMTFLSLGYTSDSGASSWINSHTLQYKNKTRSQYFIMPDGDHALKK